MSERQALIPMQEYNELLAEVEELRQNQEKIVIYEKHYYRPGHNDYRKIGYNGKDEILKRMAKELEEIHAKLGREIEENYKLRGVISRLGNRSLLKRIFNR